MKVIANPRLLMALFAGSLLFSTSRAVDMSRHLLASAAAQSSSEANSDNPAGHASASASATSEGGVSTAHAFASTTVLEEVANVITKAFQRVQALSEGRTCHELIAESEVEVSPEAQAIASVYATTFGEVSVEGQGEACIDAYASGAAEAKAFALAIAQAIVDQKYENVERNQRAQALADAISKVISAGVATAFAEAYASGCTTSGYGVAEQHSFAEAIVNPIARAYALAIGGPACLDAAQSDSTAQGSSTVEESVEASSETFTEATGETTVEAGGDAQASTEQITDEQEIKALVVDALERCRGVYSSCCRIMNKRKDFCDCSRSIRLPNPRCNMKKYSAYGVHTVWEDMDSDVGYMCRC